jgi:hypothetical protein
VNDKDFWTLHEYADQATLSSPFPDCTANRTSHWATVWGRVGVYPAPGGVVGNPTPVASDSGAGYTYTVVNPEVGVTYTWSVPADAQIVSGQGSPSVQVRFGPTSGNVSVVASNAGGVAPPVSLAVTISGFDYEFTGTGTPLGWQEAVGTWSQANGAYTNTANSSPGMEHSESVYWPQLAANGQVEASFDWAGAFGTQTIRIRGNPNPVASGGPWASGYRFSITGQGKFGVFKQLAGGQSANIKAFTVTPAINTAPGGTNVLKVVFNGNSVSFRINGTLVWQTTTFDTTYPSGYVGMETRRPANTSTFNIQYAKFGPVGSFAKPNREGSGVRFGVDPGALPGAPLTGGLPESLRRR